MKELVSNVLAAGDAWLLPWLLLMGEFTLLLYSRVGLAKVTLGLLLLHSVSSNCVKPGSDWSVCEVTSSDTVIGDDDHIGSFLP